MKFKMQTFTSSDGLKLAYFDSGSGSDTVVFLSGYGAPAISWNTQIKALNKKGIRTIAFDRRCHGASEHSEKGMNMLRHGQDVHELFENLKLENVILVGQSQGASTMWAYISQYGTKDLKAVVSVDQTPKMINKGDWSCGMYKLTPETRPTFFDNGIPAPNKKKLDLRVIINLLLNKKFAPEFDQVLTNGLLLDHTDADWRDTIAKTDVPVLFMAGGESPFWPPRHAELMAELAPNAKSYVFEGTGHAINWESVNEFNKVLIDFIEGL